MKENNTLPDRGVQSKSAALSDGLSKDPTLLQLFSTRITFIRYTPGWGGGRTMKKVVAEAEGKAHLNQ